MLGTESTFEGIGCEKDLRQAMHFYQQAERLYFDRLHAGDFLIKGSLKHVLFAEQQCRIQMLADIPDFDWTK